MQVRLDARRKHAQCSISFGEGSRTHYVMVEQAHNLVQINVLRSDAPGRHSNAVARTRPGPGWVLDAHRMAALQEADALPQAGRLRSPAPSGATAQDITARESSCHPTTNRRAVHRLASHTRLSLPRATPGPWDDEGSARGPPQQAARSCAPSQAPPMVCTTATAATGPS